MRGSSRRWNRRGASPSALVGLGALAGLAAPASAHATLESTQPGRTARRWPSRRASVVLHFDQQVSVSPTSIEVFNSSAKRVDSGDTRHVPNDSHSVETADPASLPAGGYVVTWRVVSADSHPVNGAFTFFIGAADRRRGDQLRGQPPPRAVVGQPHRRRHRTASCGSWPFVARRRASWVGLVFATLIWPDAPDTAGPGRILWSAPGGLALTTAAAFALQGVYGAGLGLSDAAAIERAQQVWDTRFGKAYAARPGSSLRRALVARLATRVRRRPASGSCWPPRP